MKILKTYKEFLNEQISGFDYGDVMEFMVENIDGEWRSFSYLAKYKRGVSANYDVDVDDYIKMLNTKFGEDTMKMVVQEIIDKKNESEYTRACGLYDIIFNRYNKDFPLGGNFLKEMVDNDDDRYLKYTYGWHKSYYGKMAITQSYDDTSEFFTDFVTKGFAEHTEAYSNTDKNHAYKTLLFSSDSSDKTSSSETLYHENSYENFEIKIHYSKQVSADKFINIIEILNEHDDTVIKGEDWMVFFKEVVGNKKAGANQVPWMEILDNSNISIDDNSRRYINSMLNINKFDL